MSFTKKVDSRMLSLVFIALIGGAIGGYLSDFNVKGSKIESLSNYLNAQLVTKDTEITTLKGIMSSVEAQVSQLENNIVDIGSLEAPDNAEILTMLEQLRDEQYILHELTWSYTNPSIAIPEGHHSFEITSSEPFEVKSVAVSFLDPDYSVELEFREVIGSGWYPSETYWTQQVTTVNLFAVMKVNMPLTLKADDSLIIRFLYDYVNDRVPDGDEVFTIDVIIESPRQAITEIELVLN